MTVVAIAASESLNDLVDRIRVAYYAQAGANYETTWVRDVMDDSVIIEDTGKLYKVPWSRDTEDNIVFNLTEKAEVKADYVPLSEGGDGNGRVALATSVDTESEPVWKQLLRPGKWTKEVYGEKHTINITASVIKDVKSAWDAGVVPHVYVPCEHSESPRDNTGFVTSLKVVKGADDPLENGLWCAIKFTEPDIEDMVDRGSIKDVSAWLTPNFVDSRDGSTWSWVLRHVALTNQPVLHLMPFAASSDADGDEVYSQEEVEAVDKTTEEMQAEITRLSQELTDEQTRNVELDGKLSTATGDLQALQGQKQETDTSVQRLESQLSQTAGTLHQMEVKTILSAYQGQGTHEKVTMPANKSFAPAILSAVEPFLRADVAHEKAVKLSVDSEDKTSVTEIILSVLNAVAAADCGMVSFESKGSQDHTLSQGELTSDSDKEAKVNNYLKDRHLAPVEEA